MNKHIRILIIFTILYLIVGLIYGTMVYAFDDNLESVNIKENIFLHFSTSLFVWPNHFLQSSSSWAELLEYSWNHKVSAIILIGIIEVSLVTISRFINKKIRQ